MKAHSNLVDGLKATLWKQFAASVDMLKNALLLWPSVYWNNENRFFYISYHTLLFLDYYLTIPPRNFSAPLPFTVASSHESIGIAVDDLVPNRIYTQYELLGYLQQCRAKCRILIDSLTEQSITERWINEPDLIAPQQTMHYSVLEILIFNLRHVQHHTAQLNLLLRQQIDLAPDWISQADDDLLQHQDGQR